jgi:hypothetical protein
LYNEDSLAVGPLDLKLRFWTENLMLMKIGTNALLLYTTVPRALILYQCVTNMATQRTLCAVEIFKKKLVSKEIFEKKFNLQGRQFLEYKTVWRTSEDMFSFVPAYYQ